VIKDLSSDPLKEADPVEKFSSLSTSSEEDFESKCDETMVGVV